jgi:pimeloyl-ACP methyl ester carboxylesterase
LLIEPVMMSAMDAKALWDRPATFVDVGSARIAYRSIGRGRPLLLVHGWPFTSYAFRHVIPALAERFTCVLPDLPGLGETEWRPSTDFRFAAQAETLQRFVRAVALDEYAVLAFDTGATIARQLALIDGERVERLVLLNTEIPNHRPPFIPLFQRLAPLPGNASAFRLLLRSRLFRRSAMGFGGCFVDLSLIDGDFHERFVQPLIDSPRRIAGAMAYLQGIDWALVDGLARRHAEIAAEVLFVWGSEDPTFPIERARPMVGQLRRCRGLVAVPGARLLVHEERPAEVAREALAFLTS